MECDHNSLEEVNDKRFDEGRCLAKVADNLEAESDLAEAQYRVSMAQARLQAIQKADAKARELGLYDSERMAQELLERVTANRNRGHRARLTNPRLQASLLKANGGTLRVYDEAPGAIVPARPGQ